MSNLNIDELVINDLTKQIADLSRDKAIFSALATQRTAEVNQLRQENEHLKKRIEELEKQKTETEEPTDEKSE
jgi:regulator of replication initiation timing